MIETKILLAMMEVRHRNPRTFQMESSVLALAMLAKKLCENFRSRMDSQKETNGTPKRTGGKENKSVRCHESHEWCSA